MDISIYKFVQGYTAPIYEWIASHGLLIILMVAIWFEVRVSKKIIQGTKAKKWSKYDYGNTNEWFILDTPKMSQKEETL